jgi:hypothetical protein
MSKWTNAAAVGAAILGAFTLGRAWPESTTTHALGAQPQENAPAPATTGPHSVLTSFLGNWQGSVTFWSEPGGEGFTFENATIRREWTLDGNFIMEHVEGPAPEGGPPFKGLGIVGYNDVEKRFESFWVDNASTHMTMETGSYDDDAKTLTFTADRLDPMTGKRSKQRSVMDISNPDRHTAVGYGVGPDGKEFKTFEGAFERVGK